MHSQKIQYVNEPLADILDLAGKELVSLAGAGGKTSLMFALAGELALAGQRVLVTTTTHIFRPPGEVVLEPDPALDRERLSGRPMPGETIVLARGEKPTAGGPKLFGPTAEEVDSLWLDHVAEYVLVEADGAKRRPLKAPRAQEPVIPAQTTVYIGVIGLSAMDRAADEETVFGLREFVEISGIRPGEPIRPEHLAALIAHPLGLFKSALPEAAAGRVFEPDRIRGGQAGRVGYYPAPGSGPFPGAGCPGIASQRPVRGIRPGRLNRLGGSVGLSG